MSIIFKLTRRIIRFGHQLFFLSSFHFWLNYLIYQIFRSNKERYQNGQNTDLFLYILTFKNNFKSFIYNIKRKNISYVKYYILFNIIINVSLSH